VETTALVDRLWALMRASPTVANDNLDGPDPNPDIAEYRRRANLEPEQPGELIPYLIRAEAIKRQMMSEIMGGVSPPRSGPLTAGEPRSPAVRDDQ
jgi:hypothetical protein